MSRKTPPRPSSPIMPVAEAAAQPEESQYPPDDQDKGDAAQPLVPVVDNGQHPPPPDHPDDKAQGQNQKDQPPAEQVDGTAPDAFHPVSDGRPVPDEQPHEDDSQYQAAHRCQPDEMRKTASTPNPPWAWADWRSWRLALARFLAIVSYTFTITGRIIGRRLVWS